MNFLNHIFASIIFVFLLGTFPNYSWAAKDITISKEKYDDLQKQIKELNQRLYNNQTTIEILQKTNKRRDEELQKVKEGSESTSELKNKIKELESALKNSQDQISQQTERQKNKANEAENFQAKLSTAENLLNEKIRSATDLTVENNHLKEKINQSNKENERLREDLVSLNEKLSSQQDAVLKGAEMKTSALQQEITTLKNKMAELQKELAEKESTSLWLINKREELTQEMAKQNNAKKETGDKIADLTAALNNATQQHQTDLADQQTRHAEEMAALKNTYEQQIAELSNKLTQTQTSAEESLQTAVKNTSTEYQSQLEQTLSRLKEQETALATTKNNLEIAEKMLQSATQEKEDLDKQILEIGQQYSDLEASVDEKLASAKKPLESRITILETQLSESKKTVGEKITLEKAPLEENNKNLKTQMAERDKLMLTKDQELKKKNDLELQLRKEINLMEVKNIALENEIIQLNEEISNLKNNHQESMNQAHQPLQDKIDILEKLVSTHEHSLQEKEASIESLIQEQADHIQMVSALEEENETLKKELSQFSAKMDEIENVSAQRKDLIQQPIKKELDDVTRQYSLLQQKYASTEEFLGQLTKEKEELFYALNKSEKEKENLTAEIETLQSKLKTISSLPPQQIKPYKR